MTLVKLVTVRIARVIIAHALIAAVNLQDHYNGRIVFKTSNQYTLNTVMKSKFKSIREGLKYISGY